jgi:hypothetical protein
MQHGVEWRGETLADALEGTPPEWTLPAHGWDIGDSFRRAGFRIIDWTEQPATRTYHDIGRGGRRRPRTTAAARRDPCLETAGKRTGNRRLGTDLPLFRS